MFEVDRFGHVRERIVFNIYDGRKWDIKEIRDLKETTGIEWNHR